MRILAISDKVEPILYSPAIGDRVGKVDAVIACGDLPFYYIEYVMTMLGKPTFYVYGNHGREVQYSSGKGEDWQQSTAPMGAVNLHRTTATIDDTGSAAGGSTAGASGGKLLLAGLEGSIRYNDAPGAQYSEWEMWWNIVKLTPRLLWNRLRHGRWLDVLVTHAPPWGIHDKPDLPHNGFKSYLYFMRWFKPRFLLHGHIHIYRHDEVTRTKYCETDVINVYPWRIVSIESGMPTQSPVGAMPELYGGASAEHRNGGAPTEELPSGEPQSSKKQTRSAAQ